MKTSFYFKKEGQPVNGNVFNIQRFTLHDGPGLRTELFLKGCPLRCRWCSNPESWSAAIQPGVYGGKCITKAKCGLCADACPMPAALHFPRGRLTSIDAAVCAHCGDTLPCADACPADAIKQWGQRMTVEDCMAVIRRDVGYYTRSGGGVTVSGGEPLLQTDFTAALFTVCRAEGIHTCCETTLHAPWPEIEKLLPLTDLWIADLKQMDSAVHKTQTGVGNELILENLRRLTAAGQRPILRIPVIPGINDDDENTTATADFILNELGGRIRTLQLLSFMRLGEEKYRSLGIPYPMRGLRFHRAAFQKRVEAMAEAFRSRGIPCLVGTKTPDNTVP